MFNVFVGKVKVFSIVLCLMTLISAIDLSQSAHADGGWGSLLGPLVNSVILPTVDMKIDEMGARMDRKKAHQSNVNVPISYPTTDPMVNIPVEPMSSTVPPPVATPGTAPVSSGAANW